MLVFPTKIRPGTTLYIPFDSFLGSSGANTTISNFATSDIKIFKDGDPTARASTNGYTLVDTDGIDFAGIQGANGFSIDLSDNTTADFYQAGSRYWVYISTITVDGQNLSFCVAYFEIGTTGSFFDTFIATLTNQTTFTLNSGPAEDNALKGLTLYIYDQASAVQRAIGVCQSYTGATKTVVLNAAPTFAIAAKDNISVMGPAPTAVAGLPLSVDGAGRVYVAGFANDAINTFAIADGTITAAKLADDAITAAKVAASASSEIGAAAATAIGSGGTTDLQLEAIKLELDNVQADTTSLLAKIGAFTGTGVNTILGFFRSLMRKNLAAPSDVGGTFDPATDSVEAIRDQGDAAWITATGFETAADANTRFNTIDTAIAAVDAKTANLPSDPADESLLEARLDNVDAAVAAIFAKVDTEVGDALAILTKVNSMLEASGLNWRLTIDALSNAPTGGGGGGTDWDATERAQIRKRLGIDGATNAPAAVPDLALASDVPSAGDNAVAVDSQLSANHGAGQWDAVGGGGGGGITISDAELIANTYLDLPDAIDGYSPREANRATLASAAGNINLDGAGNMSVMSADNSVERMKGHTGPNNSRVIDELSLD